jgi:hypothetical protein
MLSRSRLASLFSKRTCCHRHQALFSRYQSQKAPAQRNRNSQQVGEHAAIDDQTYAMPTALAVDYFQRFVKYSLVGLFTVGFTIGTAFEATHMWVENVELAPDTDEEVHKWEWDLQTDAWSGGDAGGTDPALGFKGRHAVRSAWMAQNWGTGSGTSVMGSKAFSGQGTGGLNFVESRLEFAQDFLKIAINIATRRRGEGSPVLPQTINALIARHAGLMELMGSKDALFEARLGFERLWKDVPRTGVGAARIAHKLGDLNNRLGDSEDALVWWARAIQLACGNESSSKVPPIVPQVAPSSPLAQRTLVSTLVSLSTYYATTGKLKQAQQLEESSLNLLRSIKQPDSLSSASPPHALHGLYVLHRAALLSIHLAEVLHGLKNSPETTIRWLTSAAESSERVAIFLMGLPSIHPDAPNSTIPHPPSSEAPLLDRYSKSKSMQKPASALLRDARRSAAEAWHLIGLLTEGPEATSAAKALECYERALGWVGVEADKVGGIARPGEGTLEDEWKVLWRNYVRARNKTLQSK